MNIFFHVYSIKKNLLNILIIGFTISLIIFSNSCLNAAKSGLRLWSNNVIPALFPFFIATELLSYTNLCTILSNFFCKIMRPLFNICDSGIYAFILGLISGYPVGAKVVYDLRESNKCTKSEASRLLAFSNNSGPLFVIGTIGIMMYRNKTIGILLFITHILSAITVGIILGKLSKNNATYTSLKETKTIKPCSVSDLGDIFRSSIINSIKNILVIGGFIVLFAVIIEILRVSHILDIISFIFLPVCKLLNIDILYVKGTIAGIIELTNGLSIISSIPSKIISLNIILSSFVLGFGGLSVMFQVLSIISKSDISIRPYILGKILQGIISSAYTYIFINCFNFFNFNL